MTTGDPSNPQSALPPVLAAAASRVAASPTATAAQRLGEAAARGDTRLHPADGAFNAAAAKALSRWRER